MWFRFQGSGRVRFRAHANIVIYWDNKRDAPVTQIIGITSATKPAQIAGAAAGDTENGIRPRRRSKLGGGVAARDTRYGIRPVATCNQNRNLLAAIGDHARV